MQAEEPRCNGLYRAVDCLSRDDMAQVEHTLSRYLGLLRLQRSRAYLTS